MKTIIRNSDSIALYTGDELNLTAEGLRGPGWIDPSLTTDTATVIDVTLPDGFLPGAYAYSDGEWTVANQAIIDAHAAEIAAQVAQASLAVLRRIDADADAIYRDAMGARQSEYTEAELQAQAFKDAGYTGEAGPMVAAWALATGNTEQWAADDILGQAAQWRQAQAAIRTQRLVHKQMVRSATTQAALDSALASWNTFVTALRAELGEALTP